MRVHHECYLGWYVSDRFWYYRWRNPGRRTGEYHKACMSQWTVEIWDSSAVRFRKLHWRNYPSICQITQTPRVWYILPCLMLGPYRIKFATSTVLAATLEIERLTWPLFIRAQCALTKILSSSNHPIHQRLLFRHCYSWILFSYLQPLSYLPLSSLSPLYSASNAKQMSPIYIGKEEIVPNDQT